MSISGVRRESMSGEENSLDHRRDYKFFFFITVVVLFIASEYTSLVLVRGPQHDC